MRRPIFRLLFLFFLLSASNIFSNSKQLKSFDIKEVMQQLFEYHIDKKEMTPTLLERSLKIYIDQFDSYKAYLLSNEVDLYMHPSSGLLKTMLQEYNQGLYATYFALNAKIQMAIHRAREWRQEWIADPLSLLIRAKNLTKGESITKKNFFYQERDLKAHHQRFFLELIAAQLTHLPDPIPQGKEEKIIALCEKQIRLFENLYLGIGEHEEPLKETEQEHLVVLRILKSLAKSLDAHTAYYSPEEAFAMKVQLEKGMQGIGVVLSEGVDGVSIAEIIKGGPADKCGQLKVGDTIVEIDGDCVQDSSFNHVLEVLRGEEGSKTVLGVLRYPQDGGISSLIRVSLTRSKITFEDKRVDTSIEPFGDGVIGKITLHSFYEGEGGVSSEKDLKKAIEEIRKNGPLYGLVLDLRDNTGGFLSQAVRVSGLFISSGVVVICKYADKSMKYYRAIDGTVFYNGPLVVLISKGSASATEIVAQTLQDYGVAVVVGDERSYGKGTIQHQTVTNGLTSSFFKVTVGKYYTTSGKSTQIQGVKSDIIVPSALNNEQIGESFLDYPLPADAVTPAFDDTLMDLDKHARKWFSKYYLSSLQKPVTFWKERLAILQENSRQRLAANLNYQAFLKYLDQKSGKVSSKNFGQEDLQMNEAVKICQDMILLQQKTSKAALKTPTSQK